MATQTEAGQGHKAPAGLAAASHSKRRITADSFRLLTARLKSKNSIPDLFEPPAENDVETQPLAVSPPEPAPEMATAETSIAGDVLPPPYQPAVSFALPDFVPLSELPSEPDEADAFEVRPILESPPAAPVELARPEAQSAYVAAESGEVVTAHVDAAAPAIELQFSGEIPAFPAFGEPLMPLPEDAEPLPGVQPEAVAAEPAIELSLEFEPMPEPEPVLEAAPEPAASPIVPQPEPEESWAPDPEPVATETAGEARGTVAIDVQPAGNSLASVIGAAKPARASSPLAEKVVDALIKTVTEAVYAKPSAEERAAFLREIADLVERGEAEAPETLPAPEETPPAPAELVVAAAVESLPVAAPGEPLEIKEAIADRLGPASQILRKSKEQDPFAVSARLALDGRKVEETPEADEDSGELAISLLDMMSGGSASSQPQERALAADTLLRMVPRIPSKQLLAISERVSIMEAPPSLLVAKLIRDHRHEIAAPLLERCMHITDQDLATATAESDVYKLRMIAKRRIISPTLSDQLIDRGDTSVILTLVRNPGASLNHDSFFRLADHAIEHHAVLAPLATRADLPAPVAFELFWHVPQELRRFILSRFLTDSENLNRILKITMATQAPADGSAAAEPKFPPQDVLEAALQLVAQGKLDQGAQQLAETAGVAVEAVLRILADREGEPVAVLLKTLGFQRSRFADAIVNLQNGEIPLVRADRKIEEIQNLFDTLSFNKARILLTYWDWYVRKAGPYAPHN